MWNVKFTNTLFNADCRLRIGKTKNKQQQAISNQQMKRARATAGLLVGETLCVRPKIEN
jgi:hypothetical protein